APFTPRTVGDNIGKLIPGQPFVSLTVVPGRFALALLLVGTGAAAIGAAVRSRRAPSPPAILVALLAVATPLGALLYSAAGSGIFVGRNLLPSFPALCVLVAAVIVAAPRTVRLAAVPLVIAALLIGAVRSFGPESRRPAFKQIAAMIDRRIGPRDSVVELDLFRLRSPIGMRPLVSSLRPYLHARDR